MKQPYAWISIAFALAFATGALAQSKSAENKKAEQTEETRQDAGAQRSTAAAVQKSDDAAADNDSSRATTWRHLYGIQVDGVRMSALDKVQVTQLQQALQDQGYYTAKVDGVMGSKTRLALRQYYLDQAELASQDLIMPQSAASLGLDEADIERVRGEEGEHQLKQDAIERTRGEDPAPSDKPAQNKPAQKEPAQKEPAQTDKPAPAPENTRRPAI